MPKNASASGSVVGGALTRKKQLFYSAKVRFLTFAADGENFI